MATPKVLHLIHKLDVGGAETQLLTLLSAFDRERFDHRVGLLMRRGSMYEELLELGVPVVEFDLRHRTLPIGFNRLVQYLKRERIDVLHAHLHLISVYGRIAARLAGTPVALYTEHSEVGLRMPTMRWLERRLAAWTSVKVTVSDQQREETLRLEKFPPERVITVPNSVVVSDYEVSAEVGAEIRRELGLSPEQVVIGNICNFREQKRLDILIEAFARLVPRFDQARLLLVGNGPDYDALREQIRRLGIEDRVRTPGSRRDIPAVLRAMDVFAITSRWEGLPINLLEAMAAARPVMSTSVGAIPDVVTHDETGLLVPAGDLDAIREALGALVASPELRDRLGQAAHAEALRRFDAPTNARKLEDMYQHQLALRGRTMEPLEQA